MTIWGRRSSCCMTSSLAAEDGLQHSTCMLNTQGIIKGGTRCCNFYFYIGTGKYCWCSGDMQALLAMKRFSACIMTDIGIRGRWLVGSYFWLYMTNHASLLNLKKYPGKARITPCDSKPSNHTAYHAVQTTDSPNNSIPVYGTRLSTRAFDLVQMNTSASIRSYMHTSQWHLMQCSTAPQIGRSWCTRPPQAASSWLSMLNKKLRQSNSCITQLAALRLPNILVTHTYYTCIRTC